MKKVTNAFREAMSKRIRDRAYISVGIGIINTEAQNTAHFSGEYAYWSNKSLPFRNDAKYVEYATLEHSYMRADGKMLFLPKTDNDFYQVQNAPLTTNNIMGVIRIDFPQEYSIKGITLVFGRYFPTKFKIITDAKELTYENSNTEFSTHDVLGDTTYIEIIPLSMIGGNKRFRLEKIVMGVGLTYTNNDMSSSEFEEFVNGVSNEIPYQKFNVTILDNNNVYNVDDNNSFINFLETGQRITLSYGITLDDGEVEWMQKSSMLLSDWKSQRNKMSFSATDIFATMEDEYDKGNKIYDRTAYTEALNILQDFGLEPDEYVIDDCLRDITLHNPMPKAKHRECLQLLCNATRCILFQDENGKVVIKANFANVIDPEDMQVKANGVAWWGNAKNVLYGNNNVYADLTRHFMRADGNQFFLPRDTSNVAQTTGYVTDVVSDVDGLFAENPILSIKLPAAYTYYGAYITFQGNPPKEMKVHTYQGDKLQKTFTYSNLKEKSLLNDEFNNFDRMDFEITKAYPINRVLIDRISFGDLSDYTLTTDAMLESPYGYAEKKTKDVLVKIFTFENDEKGEPKEVEDSVYLKRNVNNAGEVKYCENQLISTEAHARMIAEWLGNYYANNISYDVEYRGDPILDAADIIYMESAIVDNLQVEVEKNKLSFNGAFSGNLELRRAMRT
jgi:hypothetical protein